MKHIIIINQNGNVLIIILIAVALFAALSFAVSNMIRGNESIEREKSSIYASEILTYAKSLKEAVQMIKISNGCSDEDISFENSVLSGYEHSPATTNKCKIFHASGGGLSYIKPNIDVNDGIDWIFTGDNDGFNIGSQCNFASCSDLIAILPDISLEVCKDINKKLNISPLNNYITQEDDSFSTLKFQGSYSYNNRISDSSSYKALDGKYSGCFEGNDTPQSSGKYYFYQILLAR